MIKVTINGKTYEVTYGPFGEYIVEGKPLREFVDDLPVDELFYMARKGAELSKNEPAVFKDMVDYLELDNEIGFLVEGCPKCKRNPCLCLEGWASE
jgi:hypothetical protein